MTDDRLDLDELSRILDAEIAAMGAEISPVASGLAELEGRLYMRIVALKRLEEQRKVLEIHYAVLRSLRNLVGPGDRAMQVPGKIPD